MPIAETEKKIEINLSEVAKFILEERYLLRNDAGEIIETPEQMFRRVARCVAEADKRYNGGTDVSETENTFYEMMARLDVLPNSPALMNAGNGMSLSACFVIPIFDDLAKIMDCAKYCALVHQGGGGTGIDFTPLRPKNDIVKSTCQTASGPVSFMEMINAVTEIIKQANRRRGANLGVLRVDSSSVLDFIRCKDTDNKLENFNISIAITDTFMEALENDAEYELFNPRTMLATEKIKAKKVWDEIVKHCWYNGDPGMLFITRINKFNPTPNLGKIRTCNPCVTGDTLVAVADGRNMVSIKELAKKGEDIPVYCCNNKDKIEIRYMRSPRKTGIKEEIYKVMLDDGNYVRVTKDHKFILSDGSIKKTLELIKNDSLQIMTKLKRSYNELIERKQTNSQFNLYGVINFKTKYKNNPEHRLIAAFYNNINRIPTGFVVHHKDKDIENNFPSNLEIIPRRDHCKLHGKDMLGDKNPMRRAQYEWSDEKWGQYKKNMSDAVSGDKNGKYCGITNVKLREHAIKLTRNLGRRFSTKEWKRYAKINRLPQQMSGWRRSHLNGGVFGLAKWAALKLGFEHINEDPRLVEHYKNMCKQGYDCFIENNHIYINKKCEGCGKDIIIPSERKEIAFCSTGCGNKKRWKDMNYKKRVLEKMKFVRNNQREKIRKIQIEAYFDLKEILERDPIRKEWIDYCKSVNISPEVSRKSSPFRTYNDLKEVASLVNHKVVSVEFGGYEDVYNGTVDEFHNFFIGGFKSKDVYGRDKYVFINNLQCGEQPLLDFESCTLGSINLLNFITEKTIKWKELEQCVYNSVHFLDNIIDVNTYILPEIEHATKKTRKIGLGIMGFHDALIKQGIRYDSDKAVSFAEKIMRFINEKAFEASCKLSETRGVFPAFKESIYDIPFGPRPRNASRTCVAPTGSISILANVSSGIEPNFDYEYDRLVCGETHKIKHWAFNSGIDKNLLVKATNISPEWHVKIQGAFQKYIDASISKTIIMPNNATKKDVSDALLLAYKLGCKSITIYRNDSRKKQVMSNREKCPQCNSELIPEEGCLKCISCGYSKCNIG